MGLKRAQDKAQQISCINNLKRVGIAAQMFAHEHEELFPNDFDSMAKELVNEKVTCCPKDKTVRYEILAPGVSHLEPSAVHARCPVHKIVVLADGRIQTTK